MKIYPHFSEKEMLSLRFYTSFFLIFLFSTIQLQAQGSVYELQKRQERDSVTITQLLKKGRDHLNANQYESAMVCYGQAADLMRPLLEGKKDTSWWISTYVNSGNQVGRCYIKIGHFDKAINQLVHTLREGKQLLGDFHPVIGDSYNRIGRVYMDLGNYESALENYQEALDIWIRTLGENHLDIVVGYNNIGLINMYMGAYGAALENFYQALEIIRRGKSGENYYATSVIYNNIGNVHMLQGAYQKSLEIQEKVLRIRLNTFNENHPEVANSYNNIGVIKFWQIKDIEALEFFEKSLKIRLDSLPENHPHIGECYNNIGDVHLEHGKNKEDFEVALDNHEKALNIWIKFYGKNHINVSTSYKNIGIVYTRLGKYKLALDNLQKALEISIRTFSENNPDVASIYSNIGEVYVKMGNYKAALENFQRSLIANSTTFKERDLAVNPRLTPDLLSLTELLKTLQKKANTLYNHYQYQSKDIADLHFSYQTYQLAVACVDKIRHGYQRQEDKGDLIENAYAVYEGAIHIAQILYLETQQDSFLNLAFTAFEKSRSVLLLEHVKANNAIAYAGLPSELLVREKDISDQLSAHERILYEEAFQAAEPNEAKIDTLKEKIFQLKKEKDALIREMESKYPKYYNLKYDDDIVSIKQVQQRLSDETALIEYFWGDSLFTAFVIQKNSVLVKTLKRDLPIKNMVEQIRNNLIQPPDSIAFNDPQSYITAASTLYQELIEALGPLPSKLIIIPDRILSYLSFDVLLARSPRETESFDTYHYLVKEHQISYSYSATLWTKMDQRQEGQKTRGGLAIAPFFDGEPTNSNAQVEKPRHSFGALKYNISEAKSIIDLIGGRLLKADMATIARFEAEASKYQILHFATHSKSEDLNSDYSYFIFSGTPNSAKYDTLYVRDLYSLRLNADLVVLSSCESGIGEWQRGEGVISLARGFAYAGANSMVTTLWSINDGSTKEIMELFYKDLKKGALKDEALRNAKLNYLERLKEKQGYYYHPHYWAAFIPVGNMERLELGNKSRWGLYLFGGSLLLAGIFLFSYFKKRELPE